MAPSIPFEYPDIYVSVTQIPHQVGFGHMERIGETIVN
jgi:hypothetical protein